jgi:hypothetical protein
MTARRATFKQSDATRALRAAVAAGLKPTGLRCDPAGSIEVLFDGPVRLSASNTFDEIQGT